MIDSEFERKGREMSDELTIPVWQRDNGTSNNDGYTDLEMAEREAERAAQIGEVDTEYTWDAEPLPVPVCLQVKTCNGAAILELEKRIAELEVDYNEMSLQNEHIVKENGVNVERIAELERERDAAQQSRARLVGLVIFKNSEIDVLVSDVKDLDTGNKELITERDAAIADARALATLLKEVDDANPTMAYSVKAYWVMNKYL